MNWREIIGCILLQNTFALFASSEQKMNIHVCFILYFSLTYKNTCVGYKIGILREHIVGISINCGDKCGKTVSTSDILSPLRTMRRVWHSAKCPFSLLGPGLIVSIVQPFFPRTKLWFCRAVNTSGCTGLLRVSHFDASHHGTRYGERPDPSLILFVCFRLSILGSFLRSFCLGPCRWPSTSPLVR